MQSDDIALLKQELERSKTELDEARRENAQLRAQQQGAPPLIGALLHKQRSCRDGRADSLKHRSFEMTGSRDHEHSWVKMAQNRAHMRGGRIY